MPQEIQITGLTGSPPYNVYVCDKNGLTCVLMATLNNNIPPDPTITIKIPTLFDLAPGVLLRVFQNEKCIIQKYILCT